MKKENYEIKGITDVDERKMRKDKAKSGNLFLLFIILLIYDLFQTNQKLHHINNRIHLKLIIIRNTKID